MPRAISTVSNVLLVIVAMPFVAVAALVTAIFGLKSRTTAAQVATYLRNFLDDSDGEWDWDDFISVPIADPNLDDIRRRAAAVDLPPSEEGVAVLRELLCEAEQLAAKEPTT